MMYKITNSELAQNVHELLNVSEVDLEKVFRYYDVTPETVEEKLRSVHEWYAKQPHLPQGQLHDQFIARYLVTQSFSVEKVKEKVDNYYTVRCKMPELLANRDPLQSRLNEYLMKGNWVVLPRRTPENHRITIFRCKTTEEITVTDIIKVLFMIADYRLWNDAVIGEHSIFDFSNVTIRNAIQFTPSLINNIMFYLNSCLGPKIKGIHIINLPPYAENALNLFKRAMKTKLVKRIQTYNNFDEVMNKFPRKIFPKDLGGDDISCQEIIDAWLKTFQSSPWRNHFIKQDDILTDESKRDAPTRINELFGVEGSFRKLQFD